MKNNGRKTSAHGVRWQMGFVFLTLTVLVAASVSIFLRVYNDYNDGVLYAERLNQMQEVIEQLFVGLEDVVDVQWENARYQCNDLKDHAPRTVGELLAVMERQARLNEVSDRDTEIMAVTSEGRYYDQTGRQGLLSNMSYLDGLPEQVSYVFNEMTTTKTQMLFLYRLDEPLLLQDGSKTVEIIYYGIADDMKKLDPYFDCKAYDGNNSTYVVDDQGLKLFSSSNGQDLLEGFNAFSVLRKMSYLHDTSFEEALSTLRSEGLAYSNAVLNGEEYYYALYRMENSAWTVIFLVPSRCVATNTVRLVDTTTKLLLVFAIFMSVVCVAVIYWVLRIQQKKALHIAEENNRVLEENNEALEKAQTVTKEALKLAETASKAKTDFLSNMSHDIRTPMNAIIGLTTLMKNEPDLSERMQDYIAKLENSGRHLLELINNVLDMNRIESGKTTLNITNVDLPEEITQVETIIASQAEERNQTFTMEITHLKHEHVLADPARLQQVLINILSNAVKYTAKGGHIRFEIKELPRDSRYAKYKFIVQDDGMGMSEEFLQHIFEPFSRMENSVTNQIQGTGLGMAITKNVVDLMGGVIHVDSTLGKGSRFEVTLEFPIDTEADQNVQEARKTAAATEEDSPLAGMRFLCAEDNELNAEILQMLLESKGASCTICHNGQQIVDTFATVRPGDYDMILMDVQMPVMDGLEATRRIRSGENPLGRTIPILAMTANAFLEDRQQSRDAGMDEHLSKPVDIAVLEQTVRRFRLGGGALGPAGPEKTQK